MQVLSSVARCDGVLRQVEVETVAAILNATTPDSGLGSGPDSVLRLPVLSHEMRFGNMRSVSKSIRQLARLSLAEREKFVKLLWITALCDGELHPKEEALIYTYADALGVARAKVAAQQPNL